MTVLQLTARDVRQALPMPAAIESSREAFTALATGRIVAPPRIHLTEETAQGAKTTLLMAASGPAGRITKVVSIFPGNRERGLTTTSGLVTILDPETGHPIGLCDGTVLTAIRTGAVAGLATDLLARRDASIAALFGAGGQAETQALAMAAVRDLRELRVYAPTRSRREAFATRLAQDHDLPAIAVDSPATALQGALLVSVATNSTEPVFDGADLEPGAHVNGVGSFRPSMRELDRTTIDRAARVVVDLRASALHEAGELIAADQDGTSPAQNWMELGELLANHALGRRDDAEITLFKSVGHAVQDLYAAHHALRRAQALGLGQRLAL